MALIKCKECGKEISDTSKICVHCGAKTEMAKKNKKKIVIITSIIILLIVLSIASIFIIKKLNDKTNLSASEVVNYLQKQGYEFESTKSTVSQNTTYYIYADNKNEKISFQRIDNVFLGVMYEWKDSTINDEWAEIKKTEENDTTAKKKQYEAYQKWLTKLGLNDTQIIEALDYYYNNNDGFKNMLY